MISSILVPIQATLHFLLVVFLFLNQNFDLLIQLPIDSMKSFDRPMFSYDSSNLLALEGTQIIKLWEDLNPSLKAIKRF